MGRDGDLGTDGKHDLGAVLGDGLATGPAGLVGIGDTLPVDGGVEVVDVLDGDGAEVDVEVGAVGDLHVRNHVLVVDAGCVDGNRVGPAKAVRLGIERALKRVGDAAKAHVAALALHDGPDLALAAQANGTYHGHVVRAGDVDHDAGRRVADVVLVGLQIDRRGDVGGVGKARVPAEAREQGRTVAVGARLVAQPVPGEDVDVGAIDGGALHVDRGVERGVLDDIGLGVGVADRGDGHVGAHVHVVAVRPLAGGGVGRVDDRLHLDRVVSTDDGVAHRGGVIDGKGDPVLRVDVAGDCLAARVGLVDELERAVDRLDPHVGARDVGGLLRLLDRRVPILAPRYRGLAQVEDALERQVGRGAGIRPHAPSRGVGVRVVVEVLHGRVGVDAHLAEGVLDDDALFDVRDGLGVDRGLRRDGGDAHEAARVGARLGDDVVVDACGGVDVDVAEVGRDLGAGTNGGGDGAVDGELGLERVLAHEALGVRGRDGRLAHAGAGEDAHATVGGNLGALAYRRVGLEVCRGVGVGVGGRDDDAQAAGLRVGGEHGLGVRVHEDVAAGLDLGAVPNADLCLEVGVGPELGVDRADDRDSGASVDLALRVAVVLGGEHHVATRDDDRVLVDGGVDGLCLVLGAHVRIRAEDGDRGAGNGSLGLDGRDDVGVGVSADRDVLRRVEGQAGGVGVDLVGGVRVRVKVAVRGERDRECRLGICVGLCKRAGEDGDVAGLVLRGRASGSGHVRVVGRRAVGNGGVDRHAEEADAGAGGGAHRGGGVDGVVTRAERGGDVDEAGGGERSREGAEGLLGHALRGLDVVDRDLEAADVDLGRAALGLGVRAAGRDDVERTRHVERAGAREPRLCGGARGGARDVGDRADDGDRQAAERAVGREGVGVILGRDHRRAGLVGALEAEVGLEGALGLGAGVGDAHIDERDVDRRRERVRNRVGVRVHQDVHGAPGTAAGGPARVERDVVGDGAHGGVHPGLAHRHLDANERDPDGLALLVLAAAVDADLGDGTVVGDVGAGRGGDVEVRRDAHGTAVRGDGGVLELGLLRGVQVGERVVRDDLRPGDGHDAGAHAGLGRGPAIGLDGEGAAGDGELARAQDLGVVDRRVVCVGDVDGDRDGRGGGADARGLGLRDVDVVAASRVGRERAGGDRGARGVDDRAVVGGEVRDEDVHAHRDGTRVDGEQLGVRLGGESGVDGGRSGDGDVLAKDAGAGQRVIADDEHVGAHRDGACADAEREDLALGVDVVLDDQVAHRSGALGATRADDGFGDLAGHDRGRAHVGEDGRLHGGHRDADLDGDGAGRGADDVGVRGDVRLGLDVKRADVLELGRLAHEGVDGHVVAGDGGRAVDGDGTAREARREGRRVEGGVGLDGHRAGDVLDHGWADDAGIDHAVAHDDCRRGGDGHRSAGEAKGRSRRDRVVRLGLDEDAGRIVDGAGDEGVGVAVEAQVGDDRGDRHGAAATGGGHDADAAAVEGIAHVAEVSAFLGASRDLVAERLVARGLVGVLRREDLGGAGPRGDLHVARGDERGVVLDVGRDVGVGDAHGDGRADGHGAAGDGEGHEVEEQVALGLDRDVVGIDRGARGDEGTDGVLAVDDGNVGLAKVGGCGGLARGGRDGGVQRRVVPRDVVGLAGVDHEVGGLDVGAVDQLVVGADALVVGLLDLEERDVREIAAVDALVGVVLAVALEVLAQVGACELGVDGLVGLGVGVDLGVVVLAGDERGVLGLDVRGLVPLVVGGELGGLGVLHLPVGARHVAIGVVEVVVDLVGVDLGVGGLEVVARVLVVGREVSGHGGLDLLVHVVLEEQRLEQVVPELVGIEEGDLAVRVADGLGLLDLVAFLVQLGRRLLGLEERVVGILVELAAHHGDEDGDAHAHGAAGDGGQVHLDVAVAERLDVDVAQAHDVGEPADVGLDGVAGLGDDGGDAHARGADGSGAGDAEHREVVIGDDLEAGALDGAGRRGRVAVLGAHVGLDRDVGDDHGDGAAHGGGARAGDAHDVGVDALLGLGGDAHVTGVLAGGATNDGALDDAGDGARAEVGDGHHAGDAPGTRARDRAVGVDEVAVVLGADGDVAGGDDGAAQLGHVAVVEVEHGGARAHGGGAGTRDAHGEEVETVRGLGAVGLPALGEVVDHVGVAGLHLDVARVDGARRMSVGRGDDVLVIGEHGDRGAHTRGAGPIERSGDHVDVGVRCRGYP